MSRREFLERAASLGVMVLATQTIACGTAGVEDDSDASDTDDGLPRYTWDGPLGPETAFEHGVASGDPLSDAVLLWTRVSTDPGQTDAIDVFVEVSREPSFARRVSATTLQTDGSRDFALTVDSTGLEPAATYYYRFSALGRTSPIGRTRTAPSGEADHLRFGVCSCSNYGFGYFHAYRHLANRPDLDAVIHLGDYIYEYANKGQGETYGTFRALVPEHELLTLEDYRARYALYRRDPDLAEVHRQNPIIHLWDDHEFACDPFVGGSANHSPGVDGDWRTRVGYALQAYSEWMPTRLTQGNRIFRTLAFGDLLSLIVLDRQRRFLWPAEDDGSDYLGKEQAVWLDGAIASTKAKWLLACTGTSYASRRADGVGGSNWDWLSRKRMLDAIALADIPNLIVVSGDTHKFDALDVVVAPVEDYNPETGAGSAGVEIAVSSISSPGTSNDTSGVPQYRYSNGLFRGYVVLDVTPDRMQADLFGFSDFFKTSDALPAEAFLKGFTSLDGANHLVEATSPVATQANLRALAP